MKPTHYNVASGRAYCGANLDIKRNPERFALAIGKATCIACTKIDRMYALVPKEAAK